MSEIHGAALRAIDPSNGELVREMPVETAQSLELKLAGAQHAFLSWRRRSFEHRAQVLSKVAALLRERVDELGYLMTEEMGKPVAEARAEVEKAAWCAEHYASHAASYLQDEELSSDATLSTVRYLPLGIVLGILPWNAPFWLAFRFCAPALMAGNTCLMKHDPHTPGCAQAIAKVFVDAGAPTGVMQALFLETPAVESVIRDSRVQAVSFTGSSRGGALVAQIAASEIKPAVLELGGSDPCVVLADADLDKAVDIIVLSRVINAGQSCIAAKRIIVEESIYDKFCTLLESKLSALRVGEPRDSSNNIGPLAREDLRQALHRQVNDTVNQGARCLMGGHLPKGEGYYYPVTLLVDVTREMTAFREETFGPVAVVSRARDEAHAIELANDTEYGLAASIWTSAARGQALASDIFAGQVVINGVVKTDPRLPSGGIRRSGYGRELGPHGIREFVNAQQLWVGPKVS